MLLATALPTLDEREQARAVVPFHDRVRWLAVGLLRAVNYGSIDLIDAAVGAGHGRGILVATHEGVDRLLAATLGMMESSVAESVFRRVDPLEPLGLGEPIEGPGRDRLRSRLARQPLEEAIVWLAAAGNDLVNAHLLVAWEGNCVTDAELAKFELRPADAERSRWTTLEQARRVLPCLAAETWALLPSMWLTGPLQSLLANDAVVETRGWRDELAHRERLPIAESPGFGRASRWDRASATVTFPRADTTDPTWPTMARRRARLAEAAEAMLGYAEALWAVERQFFASVGVDIEDTRDEGTVRVRIEPGAPPLAPPRTSRDPVLLLGPPALRG